MRRLKGDGYVRAFRWAPSNQVVYYLPRHPVPRDVAHALAISQVWLELSGHGVDLRTWALGRRQGTLTPDAILQGRMIEVDRGTESWPTLRSKLRRYEAQGGACVWWVFQSLTRAQHAAEKFEGLTLPRTCWHLTWDACQHPRPVTPAASLGDLFERSWSGW